MSTNTSLPAPPTDSPTKPDGYNSKDDASRIASESTIPILIPMLGKLALRIPEPQREAVLLLGMGLGQGMVAARCEVNRRTITRWAVQYREEIAEIRHTSSVVAREFASGLLSGLLVTGFDALRAYSVDLKSGERVKAGDITALARAADSLLHVVQGMDAITRDRSETSPLAKSLVTRDDIQGARKAIEALAAPSSDA